MARQRKLSPERKAFINSLQECKNSERYGTQLTLLKKMMNFVTQNYVEKLTLEEIAAAGYVSKRTCENIFSRYLNKSPFEYLTDVKLRKSLQMLETSDVAILEISVACGNSGASYYAETFRKVFSKSRQNTEKQ